MTERRRRQATIAPWGILLCATALHASTVVDLASEAAPSIRGTATEDQFGHCMGSGDLDGDGSAELVVGAPGLADSAGGPHAGAVFVFRLSALDTLSVSAHASDLAERTVFGGRDHGRFGSAVAIADLDADGFDDLAVGAPAAGDENSVARGEVSVYFGSPSGSWSLGPNATPDATMTGASSGARLGSSMLARDIDGDGAAELLISAPAGGGTAGARPGAVYVVEGEALRSLHEAATVTDVAVATIVGENAGDALTGLAVADTDGDGVLELVLGACQADGPGADLTDAGRLYVVGVHEVLGQPSSLPLKGTHSLTGDTERGFLGRSISVGDIDYDGIDDLLVSAYASKVGGDKLEATGEAFVLFGNAPDANGGGRAGTPELDDPAVPRFRGGSRSDLFGLPVLLADLNGDGAHDIITASQYADGPDDERNACGEIYVYRGSLRSVMAAKAGSADLADITVVGENSEDAIGGSLLVIEFSEGEPPVLIIGAPNAPGAGGDGETVQRCGKLILLSAKSLLR
ncbi:MAG: integrin alpha [Candidatus Eisenbacteria bacterium]